MKEKYLLITDKKLMEWIRQQAHESNRSVNNFINTVLLDKKKEDKRD